MGTSMYVNLMGKGLLVQGPVEWYPGCIYSIRHWQSVELWMLFRNVLLEPQKYKKIAWYNKVHVPRQPKLRSKNCLSKTKLGMLGRATIRISSHPRPPLGLAAIEGGIDLGFNSNRCLGIFIHSFIYSLKSLQHWCDFIREVGVPAELVQSAIPGTHAPNCWALLRCLPVYQSHQSSYI